MYKLPFLYFIIICLFVFDICLFSFFEQPYLYSLSALYILLLFIPYTLLPLMLTSFLSSVETHLYYGYFGIPLLYLLPITWFTIKTKRFLYDSRLYPLMLLFCCFSIQYIVIERLILGLQPGLVCTSPKIIANIIVIACLFLTYISQGKQGNRL
jgi:hypothetical protein